MSKGDLKTQGQKGYNAPWQRAVLEYLKKISEGIFSGGGPLNTKLKGSTPNGNPTSRSKSVDVTALDVQIVDAGGNPITSFVGPSTSKTIPTTVIATSSGTVLAGSAWINFTTSSDFQGTINGQTFPAGYGFMMPVVGNRPYPAIPYTVTSGNIRIDTAI